jgi:hypothetical protein
MEADRRPSTAPLEDVLITRELLGRPSRPPDYERESDALQRLVPLLADAQERLLQRLLVIVRESSGSDSAGVTLLERSKDGAEVFRWAAASRTDPAGSPGNQADQRTLRPGAPWFAQLFREPARFHRAARASDRHS